MFSFDKEYLEELRQLNIDGEIRILKQRLKALEEERK
jgi:hypothetical protein